MTFQSRVSKACVAGAAVLVASAVFLPGTASALPQFTLNPLAVTPTPLNATRNIVADNIVVSDFSTIAFTSGTPTTARNFTDVGFLPVSNFQLVNGVVPLPNLNQANGYGFYIQFSGTGTQNAPNPDGSVTGVFNSLTARLFGYNLGASAPGFSPNGVTTTGIASPELLANLSLINGTVFATQSAQGPIPGANALLAFAPAPGEGGFFVSPNPFYVQLTTSFVNTFTQVTPTANGFTITQGGGSANFLPLAVPEPASLALLATGMIGLGMVRRRRS